MPSWDENWRLLRQLWPSWEPTAEAIRHVWFLAYDKPNAPQGAGFIDHGAIKKAIIEHARSSRWKEPEFLAISKLYTEYKNEKITTRAKNAMRSKNAAELDEIQREHEQRMAKVRSWDAARIALARELVSKRFPSFVRYTINLEEWSVVYSGLICAVDEELRS